MKWFDLNEFVNWFDGFWVWGSDVLTPEYTPSEEPLPLQPAKDHIEALYTELGGEQ